VTFDDIRKIALAWPEVEDGTSYGTPALKVRKKLLVRLKLFYFTDHYRNYPMVLIRLSKAKRADVEPLLRRQWRTLASKATVREFDIGRKP